MAPAYARPRWVRIVSNAIAVIMLALTVVMVALGDWFLAVVGEPGPYLSAGAGSILGLWSVAAAFRPGFGGMFGVFAAIILVIIPIVVMKFLRGHRRCSLRITPGALSVPDPGRDYVRTEIPRERIRSIAPASEIVGYGSSRLQLIDITYAAGDSGSAARTVLVGQAPAEDTVWLTLNPLHLRAGLQVRKDRDPNDPQLLDRVESVLRAGVSGQS